MNVQSTSHLNDPNVRSDFHSNLIGIDSICDIFQNYFSALTTTSPNSILLASIDASRAYFSTYGIDLMKQAIQNTNDFRSTIYQHGNWDETNSVMRMIIIVNGYHSNDD